MNCEISSGVSGGIFAKGCTSNISCYTVKFQCALFRVLLHE